MTVGLTGSSEVEILSGLNPGQTVYYTKELTIFDFFANAGMPMGGMSGGTSGGMGGTRPGGSQRPQGEFPGGKQGG